MGEARRRREAQLDAYATGKPVPRPDACPACRSKRILVTAAPPSLAEHVGGPVPVGICADCKAVWEAFQETYVEDPVCAEPCDNCAFRPGSPEQQDKEKWRALVESLRPQGDGLLSQGRFYCHKNVPIDMEQGPGDFLFPQREVAIEIDGVTTRKTVPDDRRMRVCSGYLRMLWQLNGAAAEKRQREAPVDA